MVQLLKVVTVGMSLIWSSHLWAEKIIGNVNAPSGGTMYLSISSDPPTLNPISSTDVIATQVQNYVMDYLLIRNLETYELMPGLAEKYEVSKDEKTFTFYLRKNATFHDGVPLTAEDVKFTFEAIFKPEFNAAPKRPYFESIDKIEVIDPQTVRFHMKKKYFNNLGVLAEANLHIVPKHIYKDPKKKINKTLIGSGPYILEKYDQGKAIILKRNPKWWGNDVAELKGMYKFDRLHLRVIKEQNTELEMLKKGDLNFLAMSAEQFIKKTDGPMWGKTVLKKQVENSAPKGYGFIGWNLKNEIFKDRDVRVAMTHLLNRKLMIEKFAFNMSEPATGPWYKQSPYANPNVKAIPFDPEKAKVLLTKAGWSDSNKDGILDKKINGKLVDFRFTLFNPNADFEKYLTIYKEDLKKAGIELNLRLLEWTAFVKKLDEQDFDSVVLAWSADFEIDPKQLWHSESAIKGGSNFINYRNPEVDKLIDTAREESNRNRRIKYLQKVYELIANDAPYAFLFNSKYAFYGHSLDIKQVQPTFKYGVGTSTWWLEQPK